MLVLAAFAASAATVPAMASASSFVPQKCYANTLHSPFHGGRERDGSALLLIQAHSTHYQAYRGDGVRVQLQLQILGPRGWIHVNTVKHSLHTYPVPGHWPVREWSLQEDDAVVRQGQGVGHKFRISARFTGICRHHRFFEWLRFEFPLKYIVPTPVTTGTSMPSDTLTP